MNRADDLSVILKFGGGGGSPPLPHLGEPRPPFFLLPRVNRDAPLDPGPQQQH